MSVIRRVLLFVVALACFGPGFVLAQPARALPGVSAEAFLLLDPDGRPVFAKNAEDDHAPASLVKMMSLYLAFEDIESGRARLEDLVYISRNAVLTPRYRMGLRLGDEVPLRVVMEGVAIASANDAATALAEHLGGEEALFVARMNEKAREFRLTATHFANPHGLPDPTQRTTARDMATLIGRLLADHPESRAMLGGQTFIYAGRVYARHIPLFHDPGGVQALKTGFTREAGYNLAVSAWRNGQQLLMIVLGARTRQASFLDAKKLLLHGFVELGLEEPPPPALPRAIKSKPNRLRPRRATAVTH
ncbi:MAG TPA: D-alanyl-D-alanine carboxypeptidase family protein [Methylomirabilota bacterium]|nr:D-alanyl-D-alanine carboxypeptidase family protein [Methylomirabilota bacterium]